MNLIKCIKGVVIIKFTKMHGIGNDYIYVDLLKEKISDYSNLAIKLSNRNFGVGSDGLVLIDKSNIADCNMRMFNNDGSEGKMCGNAIRCVGKYIYENGYVNSTNINIETLSGIKHLQLDLKDDIVIGASVNMGRPILNSKFIPVDFHKDHIINEIINIDNNIYNITCVSMGNPHTVIFLNESEELDTYDVAKVGKLIEENSIFPEKTNVEFVKILSDNNIQMRVWERGSGETLACGTGACAAFVASVLNNYIDKNVECIVNLKGGTLKIKYRGEEVYMSGSAEKVFIGEVEI